MSALAKSETVRASTATALAAVLCWSHVGCGVSNAPATDRKTTPAIMRATTQPQQGDVAAVKRLTGLRWVLLGLQQQYLSEEGIKHRGKRFGELVNAVGSLRMQEPPLTEVEVLNLLGAPDYAVFDEEGGEYAYVYSRTGEKDSVADIRVSRLGFVDRVSYSVYKPEDFAATPGLMPLAGSEIPGNSASKQSECGLSCCDDSGAERRRGRGSGPGRFCGRLPGLVLGAQRS